MFQIDKNKVIDSIYSGISNDISWLKENTLFLTVHGSISYGLNTPESDVDIRGITSVPKNYLLGFNKNFNEFIKKEPDTTIFSIIKFFKLSSKNNPNALEIIYTDEKFHLFVSDLGKIILENRDLFLSKQIKETYIGYAKAQAHRISQHRNWLLNPVLKKPERADYNLPEKPSIDKNAFDAIKSLINKKVELWNPKFEEFSESQKIYLKGEISDILAEMHITRDDTWAAAARTIGLNDNVIEIIKKEKEFENKVENYKNYVSWKQNRNKKRAELEEKYGFDLKHATQLVRLLKMGKEILETGIVQVERIHDKEELLEIKTGKWKYEDLISYADKIESEMKTSYLNSKLPNQPNINKLDEICQNLTLKSLK